MHSGITTASPKTYESVTVLVKITQMHISVQWQSILLQAKAGRGLEHAPSLLQTYLQTAELHSAARSFTVQSKRQLERTLALSFSCSSAQPPGSAAEKDTPFSL